jgi:hypothetical protein
MSTLSEDDISDGQAGGILFDLALCVLQGQSPIIRRGFIDTPGSTYKTIKRSVGFFGSLSFAVV